MPEIQLPEIRLFYEEHGAGLPILCIHGTSSSALAWGAAIEPLSRLGRVIAYDRRGCTRSERPQPYETTSVPEHADDAAALLKALDATPAIVIGRSYGGEIALNLALRYAEYVRALVLLEPANLSLSAAGKRWEKDLQGMVRATAAERGVDAVAEAFLREVAGDAWDHFPAAARQMFTANGQAIIAELTGGSMPITPEDLSKIRQPALLVSGAASPPVFREVDDVIAAALPNSRTAVVAGGHLINPADPAVLQFIEAVLSEVTARSTP
jgi:pimeloyl-ACP methyl ester carboxylesterase